jgi:hypothetical protein
MIEFILNLNRLLIRINDNLIKSSFMLFQKNKLRKNVFPSFFITNYFYIVGRKCFFYPYLFINFFFFLGIRYIL